MDFSSKRLDFVGKKHAPHILAVGTIWVEDDKIPVLNPANGQVLGMANNFLGTRRISEIDEWAAFSQQAWHWEVTEQEKELVFRAIIANFEKYRGILARTMVLEGGKLWRWAEAEVQEAIDTLWHYHGELSRYYTKDGYARCQMPDKNAFSVLIPWGKVLKISPWNFPLAVPMWSVCGALAGGNSIVLKCAEQTPFTMFYAVLMIQDAIREVLPKEKAEKLSGLVQLVQGSGEKIGKLLLENLDYDLVTFTGSSEVGSIVAVTAASRRKLESGKVYSRPSHLELGGHAAMVVLDDFDVDLAVREAINANLGDSGQRCVSTRVVWVAEDNYKEFVQKYITAAKARRIGNPMDFETEMGPLVSKEQLGRVYDMVAKTVRELGRLPSLGGLPLSGDRFNIFWQAVEKQGFNFDRGEAIHGNYFLPTVFTEVPYGVTAMDEEIFGPVIVINPLSGRNREEMLANAIELVNKSQHGLSNALLTNDRRISSRSVGRFHTGIFYIGRGTTGAELNKYFGGVKASGWGREGRGIDDWTQILQVYDDFHGKARMAQAGADDRIKELFVNSSSPLED